jgi:hypothetical protein
MSRQARGTNNGTGWLCAAPMTCGQWWVSMVVAVLYNMCCSKALQRAPALGLPEGDVQRCNPATGKVLHVTRP